MTLSFTAAFRFCLLAGGLAICYRAERKGWLRLFLTGFYRDWHRKYDRAVLSSIPTGGIKRRDLPPSRLWGKAGMGVFAPAARIKMQITHLQIATLPSPACYKINSCSRTIYLGWQPV
jgi:hypothetical protein